MSGEEKSLQEKIKHLEETIKNMEKDIVDLENKNSELEDDNYNLIRDVTEANERISVLECDFDNMKDSRDELKYDFDTIKDKLDVLEVINGDLENKLEILECFVDWRQIIPNREDSRSQEIYDHICDLLESFVEYPVDMARLYRNNPNSVLDNVIEEKLLETLKGDGAALLNLLKIGSGESI